MIEHGLAKSFVTLQTDHTNGITLLQKMIGDAVVVFQRPGTNRQDATAGVNQYQRLTSDGGKVCFQLAGFGGNFTVVEDQRWRRNHLVGGYRFPSGMRCGINRIDHGQQLMAEMTIRVIHHRIGEISAAVEALLGMGLKTYQHWGAAHVGNQATDPGKQFAVDNDVKAQAAHFLQGFPQI